MKRILIAGLFLLPSCSFLQKKLTEVEKEPPVPKEQQYLAKGGVSNELDLGPDQKFLLDEFTQLKSQKVALESQVNELRVSGEGLRVQLKQAEDERDKERRLRAGADAEVERLRKTIHEREAKVLSLSMERARLNREILLRRSSSLERQIAATDAAANAAAAEASAPAGGK